MSMPHELYKTTRLGNDSKYTIGPYIYSIAYTKSCSTFSLEQTLVGARLVYFKSPTRRPESLLVLLLLLVGGVL